MTVIKWAIRIIGLFAIVPCYGIIGFVLTILCVVSWPFTLLEIASDQDAETASMVFIWPFMGIIFFVMGVYEWMYYGRIG